MTAFRSGISSTAAPFLWACILLFASGCRSGQKAAVSILDKVLVAHELRVGLTGDYPPFSYLNDRGEYEGIDVVLAMDLAETLDAEVRFVKTTWPTLIADLKAGRFDMAMGGISKNLLRQRVGLFSKGYSIGGKTPIARCEDAGLYASLEQIDRAGVRVIVNPGGTNQAFVNRNIHQATVIVFNDNTAIFREIREDRADVMITDSEEVRLQHKISPDLCPTMPGKTFDQFEKACLLPRDLIWKAYVDAWVEQRLLDGTIAGVFSRFLD